MSHPCIVPHCENQGTHSFPADETRRAEWIRAVQYLIPRLTIKKHSRICSAHFKSTDFNRTPLSLLQSTTARRTLKKSAVPSIFPWKTIPEETPSTSQDLQTFKVTEIKKTYSRTLPTTFVHEQTYLNSPEYELDEDPLKLTEDDAQILEIDFADELKDINIEMEVAEEVEISSFGNISQENFSSEMRETSVQTENNYAQGFSFHNYKNNDKAIHFYTGLENFNKVMFVFNTLGQSAYKLNYFYGQPVQKLDVLEQFFIILLILRRHKPFEEIAMMYQIPIKQVYNIFITFVRFMYLQWKNLDLWIERESVKAYMPLDFYDKFPSTRVIIDATECPIKKPKLPFAQQATFSSYKNKNTIKFLIGITPSGLINYVSPCYGGSATDRQIIERSSILTKFDYNDEIMVDKGLNVQDIFLPYGIKINMPSFFKKGTQIRFKTLTCNRRVASKRVHIERVIGMLKTYKILTQPMNQTEIILSSNIVFICAMLVNFRSNIINKYA